MKLFVLGAGGLLGRAMVDAARDAGVACGAATRAELDATDTKAVLDAVGDATHVVFAAAKPHVEECERAPDATARINVEAPIALARALDAATATLVCFSSEYVFDGRLDRPYREDDAPAPLNVYGEQKLKLERALSGTRHLVLRVSGLYGPEPARKNFVFQLWDRARRGERVKVPSDQMITPTYTPSLARLVIRACERGLSGILHLAGPRPLLRVQFAKLALAAQKIDGDFFEPVPTASLGLLAARPPRAALDVSKAMSLLPRSEFTAPEEGLKMLAEQEP